MIKKILIGILIGGLVGTIILGLGGRLLMRIIMLMSGGAGGFSMGGSLEVVAFGGMVGAMSGVAFVILQKLIHGRSLFKGFAIGLLTYAALVLIPFDSKQAANGFPEMQIEIFVLFGLLLIVFGLVLGFLGEKFMSSK